MEDPVREIPDIVLALTTSTPEHQKKTLETYFLTDAAFDHPFVLLPSFFFPLSSRTALLGIYRFYKFLSPNISLRITSIALDSNPGVSGTALDNLNPDEKTAVLYVRANQTFRFWFWPFWDVIVELVSQLTLVEKEEGESNSIASETVVDKNEGRNRKLWYIKEQKDLYQVDQFLAYLPFLLPGVPTLIRAGRRLGALMTVLMVTVLTVILDISRSVFDLTVGIFGRRSTVKREEGHFVVDKKQSMDSRRPKGESHSPLQWLHKENSIDPLVGMKEHTAGEVKTG